MKTLSLTPRDLIVLEALSLRVRLIGLRQLADALWFGHAPNTRRRLRQLVSAELLRRDIVPARPLPEIVAPICAWQPGAPEPDAGQVSFCLRCRWTYTALRPTVVYLPTDKTVTHFGGRAHHRQISTQVTHDLGVAAVWLWFQVNAPRLAAAWCGEDMIAPDRRGETLPDAVLLGPDGEPATMIEFGGSYGPRRITEFHDDAAMRGLPYQIW